MRIIGLTVLVYLALATAAKSTNAVSLPSQQPDTSPVRHEKWGGSYSLLESWSSAHLHTGSTQELNAARALGMSVMQFRLAHKQLMEQRQKLKTGMPSCGGLVASLCQSCANGGPGDFCDGANKACGEIFCYPFCLRQTWTCKVDFGPMEKEGEDERYGKALCGQFMAQGCSEILQCCDSDDKLYQWVEDHVWGEGAPGMPSPTCEHDKKDGEEEGKECGDCQSAINVELEATDCPYPDVAEEDAEFIETASSSRNRAAEAEEEDLSEEEKRHVDSLSIVQLTQEVKVLKQRLFGSSATVSSSSTSSTSSSSHHLISNKMPPKRHLDRNSRASSSSPATTVSPSIDSFLEQKAQQRQKAVIAATTTAKAPWDAGPPKHKSLKYRCSKLKAAVEGAIGGMQAAFKEKACPCLGCCPGDCFFPEKERVF